jgi:hypothetical protein
MVTNAMKHTLIISTTTCLFRFSFGEGRRAVRRAETSPETSEERRARSEARAKGGG